MRNPMLIQLIVLLAYSLFFIVFANHMRSFFTELHWAFILAHTGTLLIYGLVRFFTGDRNRDAWQYIVASILVATIGHGLCFFNGLVNFNVH